MKTQYTYNLQRGIDYENSDSYIPQTEGDAIQACAFLRKRLREAHTETREANKIISQLQAQLLEQHTKIVIQQDLILSAERVFNDMIDNRVSADQIPKSCSYNEIMFTEKLNSYKDKYGNK